MYEFQKKKNARQMFSHIFQFNVVAYVPELSPFNQCLEKKEEKAVSSDANMWVTDSVYSLSSFKFTILNATHDFHQQKK